ncbi:RNA-binding cell elongation regulator Jag/EloR [Bacillus cytotoxicus]|uniref:RNA-binding protein KhpB n=2 Tax=Bacillus cytotoxicus TaxID=580165 RepID=A0AAX2CNI3_9BACI|nr:MULTISPECIES: RNA-binding cell elongation regulator Jag/EloR [Bacillus cereus group]ABS24206.1 single-stranded nucleic acid binding R3H domain protein [Bacillus cytotoxicus NVH 391-98]AWC30750.1 protein jag [Bacillus cytotoxicus]AWC34810.1 protein jag [Bacillus cytotoxicus]AWC38804.1 protein jag [Bacillus cytotoxicus]AWC42892.1 protein jag [Bacillus cytotoxicus]
MSIITAKGQTVELAVQDALRQLKVSKEQVDINIIDEGKRGFLGLIGNRPAVVEVIVKKDPVQEAEEYLRNVVQAMGVDVAITKKVKGRDVEFILSGKNVGVLIGKRGHTLNSLQYLTNLVANRSTKQYVGITIDAENYRSKRKDTLESLAYRLAKQVASTKKNVVLEPMPSFERKIIHQALANHPNVITSSEGKDPHRHVVISPK